MGRRGRPLGARDQRVVFRRAEIPDDKLAQLNVLHTEQDRQDFDEVAARYLDELSDKPKSAAEIQSEADDFAVRVSNLKAKLGVVEDPGAG